MDLTNRMARCYCGEERPSSKDLPFFQFCGVGSLEASSCKCGFYEVAHHPDPNSVRKKGIPCDVGGYTPKGDQGWDKFYCGCRGWD
jgi:hypothetical protein